MEERTEKEKRCMYICSYKCTCDHVMLLAIIEYYATV